MHFDFLNIFSLLQNYHKLTVMELFRPNILVFIKLFVVTNCSKERPGSIVNKTLKNGTSMLKDISKELDFYADFKYVSFIKFSLSSKVTSLRKFALFWKIEGNTP